MTIGTLYNQSVFWLQKTRKSKKHQNWKNQVFLLNFTAKYYSKDYFCFSAVEKIKNMYDVNNIDIIEGQISIIVRIK